MLDCHLSEHHGEQVLITLGIEGYQQHWHVVVEEVKLEQLRDQGIIILSLVPVVFVEGGVGCKDLVHHTKHHHNRRIDGCVHIPNVRLDQGRFDILRSQQLKELLVSYIDDLVISHGCKHNQQKEIADHRSSTGSPRIGFHFLFVNLMGILVEAFKVQELVRSLINFGV